jgi:type II secretory pathway pseudopilin PulG
MEQLIIVVIVVALLSYALVRAIKKTISTEISALRNASNDRFAAIENRISDNEDEIKGHSLELESFSDDLFSLKALSKQQYEDTSKSLSTLRPQLGQKLSQVKKKAKKKKKA